MDQSTTMDRAIRNAATVRMSVSPNPSVGVGVVAADEMVFDGATSPPGGRRSETRLGETLRIDVEPIGKRASDACGSAASAARGVG
jgi:pyrimidine deaminase RibD-like protein